MTRPMPPNQPAVSGRSAIQEWAAAHTVSQFSVTEEALEGRGDLAFRRGQFDITLTMAERPDTIRDEGKFVEIWRQGADGAWKIGVDIWNSNRPPAGAAPAPPARQ